jgi:hypothetical protein
MDNLVKVEPAAKVESGDTIVVAYYWGPVRVAQVTAIEVVGEAGEYLEFTTSDGRKWGVNVSDNLLVVV